MVRSEFVELLARRFPYLSAKDVAVSVTEITQAIASALVSGGRVEIRGFGSFGLNYRPSRIGRNPKTGEKVDVPAKYMPHFKPGKELRNTLTSSV